MAARRVLVTGGAGFIGSHVVDAFLGDGADVLVVDDLSTGLEENVASAATLERLDIVDGEALGKAAQEFWPDLVCHLAAQASVTFSVRDPRRDLDVNVLGTLNVLEAARAAGAPVVFASTGGALYGDQVPLPAAEDTPAEPLSPYGASKLAGEAYVRTWGLLHGLGNVVLRLGNVYGPRQNPHGEAGVVAIFCERLLAGETPTVFGDGEQTRDYVHVSDVADAFVRGAGLGGPGTFNVGTGWETSVNDLLRTLQETAGTSLEPRFEPLRPGELLRSSLECSKARDELGWSPEIELHSGLAQTLASYSR
jgi:UDP-glucose 4-epimerase